MKKHRQRLCASVLAAIMIISGLPISAYAEEDSEKPQDPVVSEEVQKTENQTDNPADLSKETGEGMKTQEEETAPENMASSEDPDMAEGEDTAEVPNAEMSMSPLQETADGTGYQYSVESGKAVITGYTGSETTLMIPDELGGYTVSEIDNSAFADHTQITKAVLPASVTVIGNNAFEGCINLSEIILNDGLEIIGSRFLKDTAVTALTVPKTVTEADEALSGTGHLTSLTFAEGTKKIPDGIASKYTSSDAVALAEVTIPEGVREIGNNAFNDCNYLTGIDLPDSVEIIENNAFYSCDNLSDVALSDSLIEIGSNAFSDCAKLTKITLLGNVTELGSSVFEGCINLSEIILNDGLESIGSRFLKDTAVTELTVPKTVTEADEALSGTGHLASLTFAEGTKRIPDGIASKYTSSDAVALSDVTIPEGVREIGNNAFNDCNYLTGIDLPGSVEVIENNAFYSCDNLSDAALSDSLMEIGSNAFSDCVKLAKITLPEKVTELGSSVFEGCINLSEIILNDGLESIGSRVLKDTAVTELTVPKTVTEADEALSGAGHLTRLTFAEGTKRIPDGIASKYTSSDAVALTEVIIPEGVREIGNSAFNDCNYLTGIDLPDSVEIIENNAFYSCDNLSNVVLSDSLMEMGTNVFAYCINLTKMTLPGNVAELGSNAFEGCVNLSELILNDGLESIGSRILKDTAVTELTVPKTVTEADEALSGAGSLTRLEFAKGIRIIPSGIAEKYTSSDPVGIIEIILPEGVEEIGANAFEDCDSLPAVTMPDSVKIIGSNAWKNCDLLSTVKFSQGLTEIKNNAFDGCVGLGEINLPSGLKEIGSSAFSDCIGIREIEIPGSVTVLSSSVFAGCTGLGKITLNDGLETIGSRFLKDTAVTELTVPKTVTDAGEALSGAANLKKVSLAQGMKKIPSNLFDKYISGDVIGAAEVDIPSTVTEVGSAAFDDFTGTLVIAREDSPVVLYAIDHEIHYRVKETGLQDQEGSCLDRGKTSYYLGMSSATTSGYINLNLTYAFKEEVKDAIDTSDMKLRIKVPENIGLVNDSFKIGGEIYIGAYVDEDGYIEIPLEEFQNNVSFSLQMANRNYLMSYAQLVFSYEGKERQETVGIVNLANDMLTLSVPDKVQAASVNVSGFTDPGKNVILSLEGTDVMTVTASKTGSYSAQIALGTPQDGDMFKIEARTGEGEDVTTAVAYTQFVSDAVSLTECTMYYRNKMYDLLKLGVSRPVISWANGYMFTFKVKFSDNSKVGDVYIVSKKNGEANRLEAVWSEEEQAYIAAGFRNYVPGIISVEYGEGLGEAYKGAGTDIVATFEEESDRGYEAKISLNNVEPFYYLTEQQEGIKDLPDAELTRTDLDGRICYVTAETNYIEKGSKVYGCTDTYILQEDNTYTMIRAGVGLEKGGTAEAALFGRSTAAVKDGAVETWEEVQKLLEFLDETSESPNDAETYEAVSRLLDAAEKAYQNSDDAEAKYKITELQMRLEYAKMTNNIRNAYDKINKIISNSSHYSSDPDLLPADEIAEKMKESVNIMDEITKNIADDELKDILDEMMKRGWCEDSLFEKLLDKLYEDANEELNFNAKYAIDPSGYVYEAVQDNRVEGVKATIYYQDPETGAVVEWNAAEYDQENPLYTDMDGAYAWDVPEGYWQVKYEKEGYETAYSDWLSVPPPQTDVNIGLVSKEKPVIESVSVYADHADVVFSKYMVPDTVSSIKIFDAGGREVPYTLEYDKENVNAKGVNYAKEYRLDFSGSSILTPESSCRLTADGTAKSYADVAMDPAEMTVNVHKNMEIIAPDNMTVKMGETVDIQVNVVNAEEGTSFEAVSEFEAIASVAEVSDNGIKVAGHMYGETEITISVPGTDVKKTIQVTVGKETEKPAIQPTVVLPQSAYTLGKGETLTITPEIYPEDTLKGSWSIVSGKDIVKMDGNTVTALKEGEAVLRYTLTEEVYAECRIIVDLDSGEPETPPEPDTPEFTDVHEGDWYYDSVQYVSKNKLMTGLNETTFGPIDFLARAQFAVILHRMNGEPKVPYSAKFHDVGDELWYTDAILWAADTGVVTGYSNGNFGPSDLINREQMALMMFRYANYKGYDTSVRADFSSYQDAGNVSVFAKEAMQWAVGEGIITGKYNQTQLDPQGSASRAECATIIMRFVEKYGE